MFFNDAIYENDIKNIMDSSIDWNYLHKKSILVTGAAGLVGTFLIDTLMYRNREFQEEIRVCASGRNIKKLEERFSSYLENNEFTILELDVNKPIINSHSDFDIIIHAASNTHPLEYASDPVGSIMTNVSGTYNLLEYGRQHGLKRFLLLSSVEVYGEARAIDDIFSEEYCGYLDSNTLRSGYPEGKRVAESLCNAYNSKYGIEFVIARLARLYGPTLCDDDSKAMTQFIMNGVHNKDIILKSAGNQRYSYAYISDAISGLLCVLTKGSSGEAYNISGDDVLPLKEIAELISQQSKGSVKFEIPNETEAKGFSKVTVGILDTKKIKSLGWTPKYSLSEGIIKTIQSIRQRIEV